jgi:SOS-response transcriptional repressor LexA
MTDTVRPTKKQRELLDYIEKFIAEHGYSPSYREIMNGCQYNSVATVALHVGSLIKRGHLRKRDHSARSLEVVHHDERPSPVADAYHQSWLLAKAEARLLADDGPDGFDQSTKLQVLLDALRLLELHDQAEHLMQKASAGQAGSISSEKAV